MALLPLMNGRGTYLFYDVETKREFSATHWVELPMPELIIERLNNLWRADYPNKDKTKKKTCESAVVTEDPTLQQLEDYVEVEGNEDNPDATLRGEKYVRVPNVHDMPDRVVVPDIVAKYDDANNLYAPLSNGEDAQYQQSEQTIQGSPMTNYRLDGEQFVIEDPAEYLESLGHTIVNGRRKSKRIFKKMIESRTLKVDKYTTCQ